MAYPRRCENLKAVLSRKENTPCATIPHFLKPSETKSTWVWTSWRDEVQAAVLRVRLAHLAEATAARRLHAARYRDELRNPHVLLPVEREELTGSAKRRWTRGSGWPFIHDFCNMI